MPAMHLDRFAPLATLPVVVLDVETTGLDPARDRIVSIAAVDGDGAVLIDALANPGVPVPPAATAIHGLADADLQAALGFASLLPALRGIVAGRAVVGHHLAFDLDTIAAEAQRAGVAWDAPVALCTARLAQALRPRMAHYDLDAVALWLEVPVAGRHTALGDARAALGVWQRLLPLLDRAGIRNLGAALGAVEPRAEPAPAAVRRLDAFPYRHRLRDVMSAPPVTLPESATILDALRTLDRGGVSSVCVERAGSIVGIATERDLLGALARDGAAALERALGGVMSAPVEALPGDDHVYRALGRLARRGFRHLGVSDKDGRIVGIVTARRLLKQRVGGGLALGDAISVAEDAATLRAAHDELPALALGLLDEGLDAIEVASVVSAELRAITARAGELAERAVTAERGAAPSRWCLLVLGSGGRGESLLAADQDNALIHEGGDDAWFAALGQRVADTLDAAGIPYCKGGVMVSNPRWRGDLAAWRGRLAAWFRRPEGEALLDVDIFLDFAPVFGARDLAEALRAEALAGAAESPLLIRALRDEVARLAPPLTLFGGIRTETGRVDLKKGGLLLLTGTARVLALRHRIAATHTVERLRGAAAPAKLAAEDLDRLLTAHGAIMAAVLRQQTTDIAAGVAPSARVDPAALPRADRRRLTDALKSLKLITPMLADTA